MVWDTLGWFGMTVADDLSFALKKQPKATLSLQHKKTLTICAIVLPNRFQFPVLLFLYLRCDNKFSLNPDLINLEPIVEAVKKRKQIWD